MARKKTEEWVLVIPRPVLDEIGLFHGISFDVDRYLDKILDPRHQRFLPRQEAERNPAFKQIVPYVLVVSGDRVLHYVRGKTTGEDRLKLKGSMGIGGHINLGDRTLFTMGRETYFAAVEREVEEEIRVRNRVEDRVVALLNDDATEVGQVHFGVVHRWRIADRAVEKGEAGIRQPQFFTHDELRERRNDLESWSQFCLDHLERLLSV
ncbi:MAG: hypothetical protein HY652_15175 [Acidobacteria bacterium]|nr:hypothetical protein [Acidobacteriota bacterium]